MVRENRGQDEQHILGSLRRAMLGVLVDTITGAEPQELQAVRRRFPKIAPLGWHKGAEMSKSKSGQVMTRLSPRGSYRWHVGLFTR